MMQKIHDEVVIPYPEKPYMADAVALFPCGYERDLTRWERRAKTAVTERPTSTPADPPTRTISFGIAMDLEMRVARTATLVRVYCRSLKFVGLDR